MNKDIKIPDLYAPKAIASCIKFSPKDNRLAIGAFDKSLTLLEVSEDGQEFNKIANFYHTRSPMCLDWSPDGSKLAVGDASGALKIYDIGSGSVIEIQAHQDIIKGIGWVSEMEPLVVTASFDKTLKYWNILSKECLKTMQLKGECFTLSVKFPLMVVGMSDRHIAIFDLNKPFEIYRETYCTLKFQIRDIVCYDDPYYGFYTSTLEGRVGSSPIHPKFMDKRSTFKCHYKGKKPCSVNAVAVHKEDQSLIVTAGNNNSFIFWNIKERQRINTYDNLPNSVFALSFNPNCKLLVYAVGPDFTEVSAIGFKLV
ncbi:WD40 repeat-like protein, partial [Neoconidiobolus thromboides FSU 785]